MKIDKCDTTNEIDSALEKIFITSTNDALGFMNLPIDVVEDASNVETKHKRGITKMIKSLTAMVSTKK